MDLIAEYVSDPEKIIRAMCMDMFWSGLIAGLSLAVVAFFLDDVLGYFREKRKQMKKQQEDQNDEK